MSRQDRPIKGRVKAKRLRAALDPTHRFHLFNQQDAIALPLLCKLLDKNKKLVYTICKRLQYKTDEQIYQFVHLYHFAQRCVVVFLSY
jgi:hypothetical protein